MTTPNPTPEKQNPPAAPDSQETREPVDETRTTGFFNRVRRELKPEPAVHPSEEKEIVVDPDELP